MSLVGNSLDVLQKVGPECKQGLQKLLFRVGCIRMYTASLVPGKMTADIRSPLSLA